MRPSLEEAVTTAPDYDKLTASQMNDILTGPESRKNSTSALFLLIFYEVSRVFKHFFLSY